MKKRPDMREAALAELRRPRTAVGAAGFVVAAAIAANALLLQAPHPSPLVSTRLHDLDAGENGNPLVRSVQDALAQAGFYEGPLDGIAGPQTRSAILAFEKKAGLAQTGEASVALRDAIRASVTSAIAALRSQVQETLPQTTPVSSEAAPAPDVHVVATVQKALALAAYGPLRTDGVFGPDTREAIMRFQRDHNLPVTGAVNDALVVELRAAGALTDG